ncbi:MAG TPA: 5'-nucleotidase [Prolixibacteraceae bacterium]|nr:5'-nucleotidase [Prolixibacteraceae bacterium]
MRRLFISISAVLLLVACSPRLSVYQITTQNIQVSAQTSTVDSMVQSILTPYRDSIEQDMSTLVAVSATPLRKDKPESKLTNLVADILLQYGTEYCKLKNLNMIPNASYVNYGGLRASLPQGEITVGHIFELMPFENEIVLLKISGESIHEMAERIAARGGEGVSGLILGIRNEKPATVKIGGNEVDPAAWYWLVTNDYVADGGDQMSMFLNPAERININIKFRDVLIQSLSDRYKKDGIISVKEDGRIYNEY